jgi:predicted membrane protein
LNKPALLAMMVALSVSTDYALIGIPNVKVMDMVVFLSGIWMGPAWGAAAGALTWMVYGTVNPFGFSLLIFLTVVPMEMLYGVLGGLLRKRALFPGIENAWAFGMVGLGATLAYDLVTNAVTGIFWYDSTLKGIVTGTGFSAVHIFSNFLLFTVIAPVAVVEADRSFFRRQHHLA